MKIIKVLYWIHQKSINELYEELAHITIQEDKEKIEQDLENIKKLNFFKKRF